MSLLQEVSVISTNWKQIIEKYPFWDTLNKEYEKELLYCCEFIELYPPLNTIFSCFNVENTIYLLNEVDNKLFTSVIIKIKDCELSNVF